MNVFVHLKNHSPGTNFQERDYWDAVNTSFCLSCAAVMCPERVGPAFRDTMPFQTVFSEFQLRVGFYPLLLNYIPKYKITSSHCFTFPVLYEQRKAKHPSASACCFYFQPLLSYLVYSNSSTKLIFMHIKNNINYFFTGLLDEKHLTVANMD